LTKVRGTSTAHLHFDLLTCSASFVWHRSTSTWVNVDVLHKVGEVHTHQTSGDVTFSDLGLSRCETAVWWRNGCIGSMRSHVLHLSFKMKLQSLQTQNKKSETWEVLHRTF
jgi:hypothetical protein